MLRIQLRPHPVRTKRGSNYANQSRFRVWRFQPALIPHLHPLFNRPFAGHAQLGFRSADEHHHRMPSTSGQTVTVHWTGSIPPLVNGTSDCTNFADTPAVDQHLPTINVPAGLYNSVNAKFTFNIARENSAGNDEILTVLNPDGSTLASSDGGDPSGDGDRQ